MKLDEALLEGWMRRYYFEVDSDIGSSGVANYSLAEVRRRVGLGADDLDRVVFHDSTTLGGEGVRRALAERYLDGDPERVMVTHGSTEANFLIMSTLLEPGDHVVVLDPLYQQLHAVAAARGCILHRWRLPYERGFRPDFGELRALLHPGIRMIVVNFPHNPTGVTLTRAEQRELIALAAPTSPCSPPTSGSSSWSSGTTRGATTGASGWRTCSAPRPAAARIAWRWSVRTPR